MIQSQAIESAHRLTRNRDSYLELIQGVPTALWDLAPGPGVWSIAEIAEHVAVVEVSTGKLITRKLIATKASPEQLAETVGQGERIRNVLGDSTPRVAPDFVRPNGRWPARVEAGAAFADGRSRLLAFLDSSAWNLAEYCARHPTLGLLDGHQWLDFLVIHTERHMRQISERLV